MERKEDLDTDGNKGIGKMSHRSKEEHGGRLFRRKSRNFGKTRDRWGG
jgi:hypothetical protein